MTADFESTVASVDARSFLYCEFEAVRAYNVVIDAGGSQVCVQLCALQKDGVFTPKNGGRGNRLRFHTKFWGRRLQNSNGQTRLLELEHMSGLFVDALLQGVYVEALAQTSLKLR